MTTPPHLHWPVGVGPRSRGDQVTLRDQLRRLGIAEDAFDRVTVSGRPLTEVLKARPGNKPPLKHDLRDAFLALWERAPTILKRWLPKPEKEYRFHPKRKWRFDVAWPQHKLAVELEGGVWTRGRHVRPKGFVRDMEKYNAALELGWRVLRFWANDLEYSQVQTLEKVARFLEG